MNQLIFASTILLCLSSIGWINCAPAPVKDSNKGQGPCTPWIFSECRNMTKGTCGKGTKRGTRSGPGCQNLEKNEPCKVACSGDKKGCNYRSGKIDECNEVTLKGWRTDILMTESSDPTCEPTKKVEKTCKKKCAYGPWTETECKDGKKTKSRLVKSGGDECRRKATKTMKCGGGGKRQRGGAHHQN